MSDGFMAKLTIIPFEDSENVQIGPPAGPPFVAQFNPESFTITNEIELGPEEPAPGDDGEEAKFKSIKPRTFSFDFLLDGTGAAGEKIEVLVRLELFRRTTGFSGKIHRPKFLLLNWGSFIATCVLESFSINYKLFRPDGTPLRAVLSASFREHKPAPLRELLKNLSSPDLTHWHATAAGEHLALITYRIYKDPRYYLHVAEANGLDNLRELTKGQSLRLPPLR
jgi:nucleoid-associated protein YgaU